MFRPIFRLKLDVHGNERGDKGHCFLRTLRRFQAGASMSRDGDEDVDKRHGGNSCHCRTAGRLHLLVIKPMEIVRKLVVKVLTKMGTYLKAMFGAKPLNPKP